MSHLHIPDGVLPVWLWASAWVLTMGIVWLSGRSARDVQTRRRVPLLAVVSAMMLVAMSTEIVPIAYHINLAVVGGTLLGPALSPVAAFIVVIVLALLGHGGITVAGLNALILMSEMVLGWALFRTFARFLGRRRVRPAAVIATVLTLFVTTTMLVGVVWLAGAAATVRETGGLDITTMRFELPEGGLLSQGLFSGGEHADESGAPVEEAPLSVARFAAVVYVLGPLGWLLEALVTALVLGYIDRVRPGLLWEKPRGSKRPVGDEGGGH